MEEQPTLASLVKGPLQQQIGEVCSARNRTSQSAKKTVTNDSSKAEKAMDAALAEGDFSDDHDFFATSEERALAVARILG